MITERPSLAASIARSCASPCRVVSTYSACGSCSKRRRINARYLSMLPRLAAGLRSTIGLFEGGAVSMAITPSLERIFYLIVSCSDYLYNQLHSQAEVDMEETLVYPII